MEFDEMKKIWNAQNNEPIYAISEQALHNRVLAKKNRGYHITNISELLLIVTNISTAGFILGINLFKQSGNVFMYVLGAWMLFCGLYVLTGRMRRIKGGKKFDRSIQGDLNHAISVATYQVQLSRLGRWNILPIGILTLLAVWESGKSVYIAFGILTCFILVNYAAKWEHNLYKTRKRELESLKLKLDSESLTDHTS